MKLVARILKEPLLHFLVLAAGLFLLARFFNEAAPTEAPDTIVVSKQRINNILLTFQRTWQRPPTQRELDGLIEDYIKEEVFYREALEMGLDSDDTMIRRRLRQKMEFVAEDLADTIEPTDEQLQQYLDDNPDSFRLEQQLTFRHIYLKPALCGEALRADAERMLSALRSGDESIDPDRMGDPFLLPPYHEGLREREVAGQFGPEFATAIFEAEEGDWSGPIQSAFGFHLVLVERKSSGRVPKLDEVRGAVRREWYAARRVNSKEEFFQSLREKYKIVVEEPAAVQEKAAAGKE